MPPRPITAITSSLNFKARSPISARAVSVSRTLNGDSDLAPATTRNVSGLALCSSMAGPEMMLT